MPIVREAGREWRAIVEGVRFLAFRELHLSAEGVDFFPLFEDALLFLREIYGHLELCASFNCPVKLIGLSDSRDCSVL